MNIQIDYQTLNAHHKRHIEQQYRAPSKRRIERQYRAPPKRKKAPRKIPRIIAAFTLAMLTVLLITQVALPWILTRI